MRKWQVCVSLRKDVYEAGKSVAHDSGYSFSSWVDNLILEEIKKKGVRPDPDVPGYPLKLSPRYYPPRI